MEIFFIFIIFIFGLLVGSFLNVFIFWLESGFDQRQATNDKRQIRRNLGGRSFCPSCGHQLKFFDLIPIFSWLFLKGKCRYCDQKISIQYPLVELGTGLIFALTFYVKADFFPMTYDLSTYATIFSFLILLIVNCLLLIIFTYDLKHKIIPNKVIYPAIVLGIFYLLFTSLGQNSSFLILNSFFYTSIASAIGAGGFFYALATVSDGKWMGGGDIKLAFFMGLLLGWPNIFVGLFLGFLTGALFGLALIFFKKAKIQSEIPFGPFLILGIWIALFWGTELVEWYMKVLFA